MADGWGADKTNTSLKMLPYGKSQFILGFLTGIILTSILFTGISRHYRKHRDQDPMLLSLKFAHALPTSHPVHLGIEHMAKRVFELSEGKMELIIFPSGQMGDETNCIEQVQRGTLDLTKTSAAPMGNFVETLKLFSLPYLFQDSDHYWNVLDGEIGKGVLQLLSERDDGSPTGFEGIGFFDAGSRNFYADFPIRTPSDLEGKKIRVMRDPVAMDMVAALGGSPTPIPWGELYTALKQGVVDGAENNPPSIVSSGHDEICKYLTLDAHSRIPDIVIMSSKTWNSLSGDQQNWLNQAMDEASLFQRKIWKESTEESLKEMKEKGVEVIEVDTQPFRDLVKPVISEYGKGRIGDLYEQIQELAD